jgi:hypothetical protein
LASIKHGDDPRRPTAEPSATGIEQNRPREVSRGTYARLHVVPLHEQNDALTRAYGSVTTRRSSRHSCRALDASGD